MGGSGPEIPLLPLSERVLAALESASGTGVNPPPVLDAPRLCVGRIGVLDEMEGGLGVEKAASPEAGGGGGWTVPRGEPGRGRLTAVTSDLEMDGVEE